MLASSLFLLGLTWGFLIGVYVKARLKPTTEPKDVVDVLLESVIPKQKGDIIKVNRVEQYLKENTGEISLGDIIENDD